MAMSVKTLTIGSQASLAFWSSDLISIGAGLASCGRGIRTSTDVSASRSTRKEMVCVDCGDGAVARRAFRSVFAARLTPCAEAVGEAFRRLVRSWPEANYTAPNIAESAIVEVTAIAPQIPLRMLDMTPVPSPHGDQ